MRRENSRRRLSRKSTVESLEDRVVMSADPVGGVLGGAIDHHLVDDVPLEQHDAPAPDFWLDPSVGDFEHHLSEIEQTLTSANNLTGLTQSRNDYGFIGTGQTVAVIDSGIAWDHYALGGGFGANYRVVGGWDFTEDDANPYDDGSSGSHGTHVSGIIGATAGTSAASGVAPGVDLVGLRVFNDSGAGYFSWVEEALQWVHQNRNSFENPITAVNMSLGTSWNAETVPSWAMLEDEFAQLEADGIFIAVSAGNSFSSYNTTGLSYPAASPHVVPVMSVDDSGLLSSFSQRSQRAIAAPGRYITSTVPDYAGNHNGVADDWASFSGTSMAAPYVAGASVLVREAMEFVGYAGITQQTIYDHMIATADQFYDSATAKYFSRLDVGAAIDALIPDDDFGSTVLAAYNLGTVTDTASVDGLIGKLSDVDYFTFTAGATGTVSFTAATTHALAAAWTSLGGEAHLDGDTYTLDVVAGQTYTVGLSTTGGLGYYELTIDAESAFSYVDWGTVVQMRLDNVSNHGESWYRMEASRAGYLTAQALFSDAAGDIDLFLYDRNLQPLLSAAAANGNDRVDALAAAGDEFFLCVIGNNSDVEFQLTNLVSVDGSAVNITGTDANDVFSFAAGSSIHNVGINGVAYQFNAAAATVMNFNGGAGNDSVTLTGTAGNETALLSVGSTTLVGAGFSASATGIEDVEVYAGGGNDQAWMTDGATDDILEARSGYALMRSATGQFSNYANGFDRVYAYASAGGSDQAWIFDGATDDIFITRPDYSLMRSADGQFYNYANGFDRVYAYANGGGNDQAWMCDGSSDDVFISRPDYSLMRSTDGQFYNYANGFDRVYAYASAGGNDQAWMVDGATDDIFESRPNYALMRSANGQFYNYVNGFDRVYAYANAGGNDQAWMLDGATDDILESRSDYVLLRSANGQFYNYANGFDRVYAYANAGGNDQAWMVDGVTDDIFESRSDYALMRSINGQFYNYANGFDRVFAYAVNGGDDQAWMFDGATDDVFESRPDYALMRGANGQFYNYANGFNRVYAFATQGGHDRAILYDSPESDALSAAVWGTRLTGSGFCTEVRGFDEVVARLVDDDNEIEVGVVDYMFSVVGQQS